MKQMLSSILIIQFLTLSIAFAQKKSETTDNRSAISFEQKDKLFIKAANPVGKNTVSIYPDAGYNNGDCRKGLIKNCPDAVGWPDDRANLNSTGKAVVIKEVNPYTGEEEEVVYYQVNFLYESTNPDYRKMQAGTGYISEKFLDKEKSPSFFEKIKNIRQAGAPKELPSQITKETPAQTNAEKEKLDKLEKEHQEEIAEKKKLAEEARIKLLQEKKESTKKSNIKKQEIEDKKNEKEKLALIQKETKKEICEPPTKETVLEKTKDLKLLSQLTEKMTNDYNQNFKKVYDMVGSCMIDPTKNKKFINSDLLFDQLVLPKVIKNPNLSVRRQKSPTDGKTNSIPEYETVKVTQKDMIDIEAMARTLVGEMGVCFDDGIQYPLAVAKIIKNRSNKSFFAVEKSKQSSKKGMISKVATHGSQFNNWKPSNKNKFSNRHSFYQSLCPAKEIGQKFGVNQIATARTVRDWETAVGIAMEAVLYPVEFDEKTKDFNNVYHYTSNLTRDARDYDRINDRKINGAKINLDKCMMLWKDKTNDI